MKRFDIENVVTGVWLGTYDAETPAGALDAMAREAGYSDYATVNALAPVDPGEIEVTEA